MMLKDDLLTYVERWKLIENIQAEERRHASFDLRWRQLNAAYGIAAGLGLLKDDPSEMGVFKQWAKIKEKATRQP